MQFIISRESLLKPLQQVCSVLSTRQDHPILSNVLLNIQGNQLSLTATDLEVELSSRTVVLSAESDGLYTVPGKKFLDICKSLPENAEINVVFEADRATIRSGRSKFILATLPSDEYPNIANWQSEVEFDIEKQRLHHLIDATQFSMASNDSRYFLNGMKFETEGNLLRTVATDGHRLAVCALALEQELPNSSIIVPRKGVLELSRLLNAGNEMAQVQIGTNNIRIHLGEVVFTSKLIDGRFPDYRRVLPRNATHIIEGDWATLKNAFVRMAILSHDKVRAVCLDLSENQLKISVKNKEQQDVSEEIIDVNYQGEPMEVAFNVTYLLDVLNALKCQQVRLRLTDASSSCLIENIEDDSAEYVIMPMRI